MGGGVSEGGQGGGAEGRVSVGFKLEAGDKRDKSKSLVLRKLLVLCIALLLVIPRRQSSQPLFSFEPFIVFALVAVS